jgi:hypothetical protein
MQPTVRICVFEKVMVRIRGATGKYDSQDFRPQRSAKYTDRKEICFARRPTGLLDYGDPQ